MAYVFPMIQVVLAAALFGSAMWAARPGRRQRTVFGESRSAGWARRGFAALSALAGVGTAIGAGVPFAAFFAAMLAGVVALWLGALFAVAGDRAGASLVAAMLAAAGAVGIGQPLGLKVLLLPRADVLPYAPVPARVVKTYDAGVAFESVRAGADGTLYLAANRGLDFNRSDYYRDAVGQIIARGPDGAERILFTTPVGATAGVIAVADDGTVFMTSNGRTPGIWRIARDGTAAMIARLPGRAWPNGLDFGPDGALYSPDSKLGLIWRIDPASGSFAPALRDGSLAARPLIALAPGANGLHFVGRDMIVTVSDSAKVLKFRLGMDGTFAAPVTIASGIPGDDFAVGDDGALFVTTHPYDTLVRIAPDGARSVIGDARQHIVGATDAVFGRGQHDRATLYVATDGGAFTQGSKARGQLVALTPGVLR